MIRTLLVLLCLLLCGCTAEKREISFCAAADPPVAVGEGQDRGSVRIFSLKGQNIRGLRSLGDCLLVFTGEEKTALTLLKGDTLEVKANLELDFFLNPEADSLVLGKDSLSFFDPKARQTVLLDGMLREWARISAPEDMTGQPVLTPDGSTLYYMSGSILRAWAPDTGKVRCVRDFAGLRPVLTGLHLEGTVLQCRLKDGDLFLDGMDGRILRELRGTVPFKSQGQVYSLALPSGLGKNLIFGRAGESPRLLLPAGSPQDCFFLEEAAGAVAVTVSDSGVYTLDYYDLAQGQRLSALTLASDHIPLAVEDTADGQIYLLMDAPDGGGQSLYRWSPRESPIEDPETYTFLSSQDGEAASQGWEACEALAQTLEKKYGIGIKIGKDAAAAEPWDYQLEPEYQTALLYRELQRLDRLLEQYPQKILTDTASHFTSLNICLVRSITGSPESGSLNAAAGVQFLSGANAYVVLAVGPYLEQSLYHELFHAMETHILTESTAFDRWDNLNPAGFQYDCDYLTNASRDSGVYLRKEFRAFVDTFSMSFPKEDRARIMEYAMMPGNASVFQPEKMQGKLAALCQGIRDAYHLEEEPVPYLWEQYLEK